MFKARLIAFEGGDRVGKQTQSILLNEYLNAIGKSSIRFEVPTKNIFHKYIYKMLKNGNALKHPNIFQMTQILNRIFFLNELFDACRKYDYVILDRWKLSTIIYGYATNTSPLILSFVDQFLVNPDITIILDADRNKDLEKRDVYETNDSLQRKVKELYLMLENNDEYNVLRTNNKTIDEVFKEILDIISL